jgi:Asp-tRNA(Asn)/Glu-tRNA(Gln) amidotransferase B subunit
MEKELFMPYSPLSLMIKKYKATLAEGKEIENPIKEVADALVLYNYTIDGFRDACPELVAEEWDKLCEIIHLCLPKPSDEKILSAINKVIDENKKVVDNYKTGKMKGVGFFTGRVLKELGGKDVNVDVEKVEEMITGRLAELWG